MKNINLFTYIALFFSIIYSCSPKTQETDSATTNTENVTKQGDQTSTQKLPSNNSATTSDIVLPTLNVRSGQKITSPLDLKINSQGVWSGHEGELGTIVITDDEGRVLGQGIMSADGEWMKEGPVMYSSNIKFDPKGAKTGRLIMTSQPGAGSDLGKDDKYEYVMQVSF